MKRIVTVSIAACAAVGIASAPVPAEAQSQRVAPRGSYADSCSGSYVNQGRLYADCRDNRGRVRDTSIELNRCSSSDIGNDNGLLVCFGHRGQYEDRSGGGGNNGGGGGWEGGGGRNTITLFRDANFRGGSQTFRGAIRDLRATGLNDAVSSMQFRGEWEACTDADFRGQCQTFRNDVRNLDRWGMNDRISSIRPLRDRDRY